MVSFCPLCERPLYEDERGWYCVCGYEMEGGA